MQKVQVWSLLRELRLCITAKNPKHKNRSNIITNTVKALQMVHIKKNLKKKTKPAVMKWGIFQFLNPVSRSSIHCPSCLVKVPVSHLKLITPSVFQISSSPAFSDLVSSIVPYVPDLLFLYWNCSCQDYWIPPRHLDLINSLSKYLQSTYSVPDTLHIVQCGFIRERGRWDQRVYMGLGEMRK